MSGYGYPFLVTAMVTTPPLTSIMIIRRAIDLSNKANSDPSFGKEACELWKTFFSSEDLSFPLDTMSVAHGMHACTLARIGKDKEAIGEYTTALELLKNSGANLNPITKEELSIRFGMGQSLQRLFRYDDGATTFLKVAARCAVINATVYGQDQDTCTQKSWIHTAQVNSIRSAALCYMRIGDLVSALSAIEKYEGRDAEIDGMYGALLLLKHCSVASVRIRGQERSEIYQRAMDLLLYAASDNNSSPLYRWIYLASRVDKRGQFGPLHHSTDDTFLAFAGINNSPFDDPDLINLDDKIRLHYMLMDTENEFCFWPQGYILPEDYDCFRYDCHENDDCGIDPGWILKERSGYGSHGNTIASTDKVLSIYNSHGFIEPILCQRIVDPPFLIDGRKFSVRIYVIYFPNGQLPGNVDKSLDAEVYISTEGLVKYAATPIDGDLTTRSIDFYDDQYMTNSGRGDGRSNLQHNLVHLKRELHRRGFTYHDMWDTIAKSAQMVMERYLHNQSDMNSSRTHLPFCCIPKIMGFDYILDSSAKPYLLEVNRFPGLEPRSSMDSTVKHTVVYDAWIAASDRTGLPSTLFHNLRPPNYKESSLKKLI